MPCTCSFGGAERGSEGGGAADGGEELISSSLIINWGGYKEGSCGKKCPHLKQ